MMDAVESRQRVLLLVALSISVFVPASAWAQPAPAPEAAPVEATAGKSVEELLESGKERARDGDWKEAYRFFKAAYAKKRAHNIVGNLGIAEHILAESDPALYVDAATHLSEALRGFPPDAAAEQREALERRLADARARIVSLDLELTPADACVRINDEDVGCGPHSYDLFTRPGEVQIAAQAEGYEPAEARLTNAIAGSKHEVKLRLTRPRAVERPEPTPDDSSVSEGFPLWPALTAGGLAVVSVAVGGGPFAAAESEGDAAEVLATALRTRVGSPDFCVQPSDADVVASCDDLRGRLERHDTFKNVSIGLFVTGGVLALGTAALVVTHVLMNGDEADVVGLQLVPAVDLRGAATLTARGRW